MSRRIGFMGGMFDPVHRGHLAVARRAMETLQLDELRMIPCAIPNHRKPASAPAADRVAMLELAIAGVTGLCVDERELRREGISYTVDTVHSLQQDFPAATLVMVIGMDSFLGLPQWHRWQEILQLCHLCVLSRPESLAQTMDPQLETLLLTRRQLSPEALFSRKEGGLFWIEDLNLDIASSAIRRRIDSGEAFDDMLEPRVAEYIASRRLYLRETGVSDQHDTGE